MPRVHLSGPNPARSAPMERLLLLDGNGLIYRGYFALIEQPLTTSKGELVTAVFGFTNIVLRAIQDVKPDRLAIAFDLPARTFRHDRYAEYKATRTRMPDDMREQIPKVKQVVRAMNIPEYEQEGFEADDAIATLVGQAEAFGFDTTILTGDLDMLQLVSEHTKLMVSLRGGIANTVAYDLAKIEERWGLLPEQMLDYKSLKGDPTDNIPGIPGVGEKTASKLIATWGSLDALYVHLDEVTPEKLRVPLEEHRESVLESRELMRLVRDVDVTLDPTRGRVGEYDRQEVVRLFREFEFRTLIDRLPPLVGERPEDAVAAMREIREAGFPAAQGVGRGAGGGRPGATVDVDPGALQLSMDFDVVSGAGSSASRGTAAGIAATSPAVEARAEAIARIGRRPRRPGRGDRRPGPDRARLPRPGGGSRGLAARAGCRGRRDRRGRSASARGDTARARGRGRGRAGRGGGRGGGLGRAAPPPGANRRPPRRARRQAAAHLALRRGRRGHAVRGRVRHPDRGLPRQRRPARPEDRRCRRRAARPRPAADRRRPAAHGDRRPRGPVGGGGAPLARAGDARRGRRAAVRGDRAAADPDPRSHGGRRDRARRGGPGSPGTRVRRRDRALRGRDLCRRRPPVHDRLAQAAGRHPVRRAGSAEGPQDEDRLFDRRGGARGAARRPPGDRARPRMADLHQAPVHLRRGAADADRSGRPAAHAVPPGRRRHRPAVVFGPEPSEHPDPDAARPADPARVRRRLARHDARRGRLQPDRAADPRPRVGRRAPRRRVRARGRHPPRDRGPGAAQGPGRRDRPTSARWPRWSTSGSRMA